jgi:hypothetical protein
LSGHVAQPVEAAAALDPHHDRHVGGVVPGQAAEGLLPVPEGHAPEASSRPPAFTMVQAWTKAARRSPPIRGASLLPRVIALLFNSLSVMVSISFDSSETVFKMNDTGEKI